MRFIGHGLPLTLRSIAIAKRYPVNRNLQVFRALYTQSLRLLTRYDVERLTYYVIKRYWVADRG